jgi:DNA-binding transcriptional ArsR family regulator
MIDVRFDTEALTRVRFAISPMFELIRSVSTLEDPAAAAVHMPWAEQASEATRDLDLAPLRAFRNSPTYNPDFVNPPPTGPLAKLEEELAVMISTPPAQIRAEVRVAYPDEVPATLRPFLREPKRAIEGLAELMREYWELTLEEHWPRIKSLLEQDILHRSRQFADGGTDRLFADLDPSAKWDGSALLLDLDCGGDPLDGSLQLDERGLLLVPSAFIWPKVTIVDAEPWQPTLAYPARGVGMLWSPQARTPPDALAKVVGAGRAAILIALERPRSTSELAGLLGISSGGVSQQLATLYDAGLVSRQRASRFVLYQRSCGGDALVAASVPAQPAAAAAPPPPA